MNCFHLNPNDYIKAFELRVEPLMNTNGTINAKLAKRVLNVCKPELVSVLNLPEEDFRLADIMDNFIKSMFGGNNENL